MTLSEIYSNIFKLIFFTLVLDPKRLSSQQTAMYQLPKKSKTLFEPVMVPKKRVDHQLET